MIKHPPNYAKKNININGNIIPINANFQPRSLKDNLPLGMINVPVIAMVINDNAKTSE